MRALTIRTPIKSPIDDDDAVLPREENPTGADPVRNPFTHYAADDLVAPPDVQWLRRLCDRWVDLEVKQELISELEHQNDDLEQEVAELEDKDPDAVTPLPVNKLFRLGGDTPYEKFEITQENLTELTNRVSAEDPEWEGIDTELLRASPAYFAAEILRGPPQAPYNGKFLVGHHHVEWDELITNHDRLCVLAPRDHGKTYFFDFAYPIWRAVFGPNKKGFIFSATKPQATRIMEDIQEEFETNPKLARFLPQKGDKKIWRTDQIRLSNGHTIYARGFGTKVRGAHPDWIVVDDGLTDEALYSEVTRNKQIDYFSSAITNMIVPGGQIIVVGTPFHETDLYGYLKDNEEYHFHRYRALSKTGQALWPSRYNVAYLLRRKREIGGIRFTREFLCDPISDDMSLFPDRLFRGKDVEQYTVKLGAPKAFWKSLGISIYFGVDFAMSSSVQADYTVIWIMGADPYGNRWIIDIIRRKGLGFQKQLSMMVAAARKYDPALIFLESNQMQRIFGDELIRETDLPIYKFVTGNQKNNLDEGVPSLRVLLENRKFRIPRGDARSVELTERWIEEMRAFTWADGKLQGVGAHDDTVMGCWICDQAIRRGGFECSFGEEDVVDTDNELKASPEEVMRELTGEGVEEATAPADVQTDIHIRTSSPGAVQNTVQALDEVFAQVLGADNEAWEVTDDGCVVVRAFGPKDAVVNCLQSMENVEIVKVSDDTETIEPEQSNGGGRHKDEEEVLNLKAQDGGFLGAPGPMSLI